ncbi:hypothetical protein [Luteimonas fraxinea]|uniref:hypothetical protein n=1 Tax=Luteimonas fraxinea TaxID=2901869 RepID=UPI001E43B41F|nr:hypothetical protein [Luteimonas fraxinea]MCD9126694.1 hypothetical protein [Luteimonas fraxinea]
MIKFLAAAVLCFAGLSATSSVEAAAMRCDGCYTDEDFRMLAEARGPGVHHVFNIHNNTIQTWQIPTGHIISRVGETSKSAAGPRKVNTPSAAVTELSKAHTLYVIGGNTIRPIFNVPASHQRIPATVGKTAHDVVWDANLRGQIESLVGSTEFITSITNESLLTAMADLMNVGTSLLGLRDQTAILIRYVLDDGSYVDIQVDLADTVGNTLQDTARTAAGQTIPNHVANTNGTWLALPAEDLGVMAGHFRRLGASMTSSGSGGTIRAIVCTAGLCDVQYVSQ